MLKILTAITVILVTLILAIYFLPVFKIKNMNINQQDCVTNKDQLQKYQIVGKNLIFFNNDNLAESLKSDFTCIDQVEIKKTFPSTLEITIKTTPAIAKIDNTNFVITKNGQITTQTIPDLPVIFLPSNVTAQPEQNITDSAVLFALEATSLLEKADFSVQNIRIVEGQDVAIYDSHGTIALFSTTKPAINQVDSLQAILAKAKIDATKIEKIDLRFDKPVIVNR